VWSFVALFLSCVCVCDPFLFDGKRTIDGDTGGLREDHDEEHLG